MTARSGISANEELLSTLAKAKLGSIRLVHMQIEDEQIKLRGTRPVKGSWQDDFDQLVKPLLEPSTASYFLYRLDSKNDLGYEWVLFTWIPDEAHVWQKTLYASTRATFRQQFGDGYLADDLLCHDKDDLSLAGYLRHLAARKAPVPLTYAEEQAMEFTADHISHASMNDGHSSMGGVAFGLTSSAEKAIRNFVVGKASYVQFQIDINQESIYSTVIKENLKPEEIGPLTPPNTGSYHLYRFLHEFNGAKFDPVVFVHAIAGYSSPIKERMLYSSCKSNLIECLSRQYGIAIDHKLEIEDFKELTTAYLMSVAHPMNTETPMSLPRPKGPSSRGPRRLIK
uniref:Twinfilin n=1 Tax=Mesocestoides corti TaxID=53468 RepID=A0A5K3F1K7_MESCO